MTYGMKRGEYARYFSMSIVESSLRILETLYEPPVLSNDPREEIGMYWLYQAFEY